MDVSAMNNEDLCRTMMLIKQEMSRRGVKVSNMCELHKYDIPTDILWDVAKRVIDDFEKDPGIDGRSRFAEGLRADLFDICDLTLGNYVVRKERKRERLFKNTNAILPDQCFVPQDYADMHKELCDVIEKYHKRRVEASNV